LVSATKRSPAASTAIPVGELRLPEPPDPATVRTVGSEEAAVGRASAPVTTNVPAKTISERRTASSCRTSRRSALELSNIAHGVIVSLIDH
jgi:hypothetical protein